jgi:hypothetical protein
LAFRCSPAATRSVPSLLSKRIQPTSLQRVPRQRRVSTLTSCLSTASFFADLHHGGFCLGGKGEGLDRRRLALRQGQLEGNAACSAPEPLLGDGAAVRWSRPKIATNVGSGVICSHPSRVSPLFCLSQRKQRQCVLMGRSGYQQRSAWALVQLRAWTGPMEKMPHRW